MSEITLDFLARQNERLLAELRDAREERGALRDDMALLLAMMQRLDGTVQGLLNEVRAQHARHERLARRVKRLEERLDEPTEPA